MRTEFASINSYSFIFDTHIYIETILDSSNRRCAAEKKKGRHYEVNKFFKEMEYEVN